MALVWLHDLKYLTVAGPYFSYDPFSHGLEYSIDLQPHSINEVDWKFEK